MAITVAPIGGGTGLSSSAASVSGSIGVGVSVGEKALLGIVADNAGTSGVSAISSVQDSKGNTWSRVVEQNRTAAGAANDGVTVALFQSKVTNALVPGDTLQVNFSPNVARAAIFGIKLAGAADSPIETGGTGGSGTTFTVTTGSVPSGAVILGVVGNESATAPTKDTDTTNGSWTEWSVAGITSGGTGGDTTKVSFNPQYKVATGAGAQTFNGSTGASTDWAVAYAIFDVPATLVTTPNFFSLF